MRWKGLLVAAAATLGAPSAWSESAPPNVVADIAPTHSIVARVMAGVGEPGLLLPPGASPHDYALRPSAARMLAAAEVVFWTGPGLVPWLTDPLQALAPDAQVVGFEDAPGVVRLQVRPDGPEAGAAAQADPGERADGHLWLDPRNAVAFAEAAAAALGAADPAHAETYRANAAGFADEMAALESDIAAELAPVRSVPYIVFHDAYQYFESRFAIPAAGSLALQEGVAPGAARVVRLRDRIGRMGIACAFAEPQFEPALLRSITRDTGIRTATLDPLGSGIEPGPAFYPRLMRQLADDVVACLGT